MSRRSPIDEDEETAIYDSARSRTPTTRGHAQQVGEDREAYRKRAIEMATPTAINPDAPVPVMPGREKSEPIRVISMKTPSADKHEMQRQAHQVKLRPISELAAVDKTPPGGMGRLAPPRDAKQVRSRRIRDLVIWSLAVLVIGAIVTVAVFLVARR